MEKVTWQSARQQNPIHPFYKLSLKLLWLNFLSVTSLFIFDFHISLSLSIFKIKKKTSFFLQVQNSLIPLFCFSQASTLPPFTRVKRGWLTTLTNWPIRRREFSHTINSAIFNLWPILIKLPLVVETLFQRFKMIEENCQKGDTTKIKMATNVAMTQKWQSFKVCDL